MRAERLLQRLVPLVALDARPIVRVTTMAVAGDDAIGANRGSLLLDTGSLQLLALGGALVTTGLDALRA